MELRWTVVVRAGGHPVRTDVTVAAPEGTELAGLLPLLTGPPGPGTAEVAPSRRRVRVDGSDLDPRATVGVAPLLDGAVVEVLDGAVDEAAAGAGAPGPAGPACRPTRGADSALLELAVLAGPDAGRVHGVPRARARVGRAHDNDVVLRDPRVSRRHGRLVVGADGAVLEPPRGLDGERLPLRLDEPEHIGASRVVLRRRAAPGGHTSPVGQDGPTGRRDGTVPVAVQERATAPERVPVLRLPDAPRRRSGTGFPVLAVVLPAVLAGALVWWTGSAFYLLIALLGPVMVMGSWWSTRRADRRDGVLGRAEHAREVSRVREGAARAARALAAARTHDQPDAVRLLERAVSGTSFDRRPGTPNALRVRVGHADGQVGRPSASADASALLPRVRVESGDGTVEHVGTDEDLVCADLAAGATAVVEPRDPALARWLVAQVTARLDPSELVLVVVTAPDRASGWEWVRWLPHCRPTDVLPTTTPPGAGADEGPDATTLLLADGPAGARVLADVVALAAARGRSGAAPDEQVTRPAVLVVADVGGGPGPVPDPDRGACDAMLASLRGSTAAGVHVVDVLSDGDRVPAGAATLVHPVSPDGVVWQVSRLDGTDAARSVADRPALAWCERLARALAPQRVQESAGLPSAVALTDLLDCSREAVAARWAAPADGLAVPLGVSASGPVRLDLVAEGPHALVAGTTGSGKSELLRTWLLAVAACHPPDAVTFLLVDYKGGATFADLRHLPHVVDVLTDLEGTATARVLSSLAAEVRRRERVLAARGARDLDEHRRLTAGSADEDPLPRLVVVVDEFRVLAEESPEVLTELVRLATTGRSLGLHLVLATQRPAGVVSAEITANTGCRIALRVQEAAESRDVVGRPDAARLPASAPGRAVLVGQRTEAVVQTAFSGAHGAAELVVRPLGTGHEGPARRGTAPVGTGGTCGTGGLDASEVVATVREMAALTGASPAVAPWLPPLPDAVSVEDLGACAAGTVPVTGAEVLLPLALADLPHLQARGVVGWRPMADGPLLVLGPARSGRSTALDTLAGRARAAGLAVVRVSGADADTDHVHDVLAAAAGRRALADDGPGLVVLVDDSDALLDPTGDLAAADRLATLLQRAGRRTAVALAGGRVLASSRLSAPARARLLLAGTDRADLVLMGAPPGSPAPPVVPGRASAVGLSLLGAPDGGAPALAATEVQVALPAAPARLGDASPEGPGEGPVRLPGRVTAVAVAVPNGRVAALRAGVLGPDGAPLDVPLGAGAELVVAGPPGSGRSAFLAACAATARRHGLAVVTLTADGPVEGPVEGPADGAGHRKSDAADLLVVDDCDLLPEALLGDLERWWTRRDGPLAALVRAEGTLLLAGHRDWFAGQFRGVPALVRRHSRGVLLHPGPSDARDVLGVREVPTQRSRDAGRGVHVERGRGRRVQLATGVASTSAVVEV